MDHSGPVHDGIPDAADARTYCARKRTPRLATEVPACSLRGALCASLRHATFSGAPAVASRRTAFWTPQTPPGAALPSPAPSCMRKAGGMLMQSGIGRGRKSVTVTDFSIDHNDSKRWQALARIGEDLIEGYAADDLSGTAIRDTTERPIAHGERFMLDRLAEAVMLPARAPTRQEPHGAAADDLFDAAIRGPVARLITPGGRAARRHPRLSHSCCGSRPEPDGETVRAAYCAMAPARGWRAVLIPARAHAARIRRAGGAA
jgi:hypothetical protein